jgi:hypothetical protein
MEENEAVSCRFYWRMDENPKLVIEFNSTIHPENVLEIADVIMKTVVKKINCMACHNEICDDYENKKPPHH